MLVARVALGGLFVWAAALKLKDPLDFYFAIKGFEILREDVATPLAYAIPWAEMIAGVMLILGWWARSAAGVIATLLVSFIGAILYVIVRDRAGSIHCGCFGDFGLLCPPGAVGWCNVGQNVMLLALAGAVTLLGPGLLAIEKGGASCCGGRCGCRGRSCGGGAGGCGGSSGSDDGGSEGGGGGE